VILLTWVNLKRPFNFWPNCDAEVERDRLPAEKVGEFERDIEVVMVLWTVWTMVPLVGLLFLRGRATARRWPEGGKCRDDGLCGGAVLVSRARGPGGRADYPPRKTAPAH